jgi:hypothetical protein
MAYELNIAALGHAGVAIFLATLRAAHVAERSSLNGHSAGYWPSLRRNAPSLPSSTGV